MFWGILNITLLLELIKNQLIKTSEAQKMQKESISLLDAQKLMLISQKLNTDNNNTLSIIEHLGYVQLDTISVIKRAHHHILWSRNSQYKTSELDELMKKRKVYEYWSHAVSILSMSKYKYSLWLKNQFKSKTNAWFVRDKKMMDLVLKRIKNEGALQSRDFEKKTKTSNSGWGNWQPIKKAIQMLFLDGKLEISHRDSFRKVYPVVPPKVEYSISEKGQIILPIIYEMAKIGKTISN